MYIYVNKVIHVRAFQWMGGVAGKGKGKENVFIHSLFTRPTV